MFDNLEDIFGPIFAVMFSAFGAAQAQGFVGEVIEGKKAASNLFNIIDEGTKMDPLDYNGCK